MKHNALFLILSVSLLLVIGVYSTTQAVATPPLITVTPAVTPVAADKKNEEIARPAGWNDKTHGNKVEPNYEIVFPQSKVNQITITIDPEIWTVMQINMTELMGEPGRGGGFPGPGGGPGAFMEDENVISRVWTQVSRWLAARLAFWGGDNLPQAGVRPQPPFPGGEPLQGGPRRGGGPGGGDGGPVNMVRENPAWVTTTVKFEGNTWTNVGFRYKGNSSLRSS